MDSFSLASSLIHPQNTLQPTKGNICATWFMSSLSVKYSLQICKEGLCARGLVANLWVLRDLFEWYLY